MKTTRYFKIKSRNHKKYYKYTSPKYKIRFFSLGYNNVLI